MLPGLCVVGFGRIGVVTATLLRRMSFAVTVFDTSERRVEEARRRGLDAHLVDVTSSAGAARVAAECDVVATALPSSVAEQSIPRLLEAGATTVVDVSYVRDPLGFRDLAVKVNARLFVDMGFAPGLSNMFAAYAASRLDSVDEVVIYVGGLAAEPASPLGLVASWSTEDLVEEYLRGARAIIDGRQVTLSPIDDATTVELPGLGRFDALPTDGLRTLLTSIRARRMVEYTLRYPGHVESLKLLRALGLLSRRTISVGSCTIEGGRLLARLLEEALPKRDDRVILVVRVTGSEGSFTASYTYTVDASGRPREADTMMSLVTGAVHAYAVRLAAEGYGHPGIVKPEEIGFDEKAFRALLSYLAGLGVRVREEKTVSRLL